VLRGPALHLENPGAGMHDDAFIAQYLQDRGGDVWIFAVGELWFRLDNCVTRLPKRR
jgi:hypothetical protein